MAIAFDVMLARMFHPNVGLLVERRYTRFGPGSKVRSGGAGVPSEVDLNTHHAAAGCPVRF